MKKQKKKKKDIAKQAAHSDIFEELIKLDIKLVKKKGGDITVYKDFVAMLKSSLGFSPETSTLGFGRIALSFWV